MLYRIIAVALVAFAPCALFAQAEWLPEKKVFQPFVSDQTQPSFATRYTAIVGGGNRAEVNMGDEFGIVRVPVGDGFFQFGAMGGVAARFNVSRVTNDFEIADFSLAFPIDYKTGDWTFRAMYWHTSSHIGDDYIKSNALQPEVLEKHVTDDIRAVADYKLYPWLRLYSGLSESFNLIPHTTKRLGFHAGAEIEKAYGPKSVFLGLDYQALQRLGWNPSFTARTGVKYTGKKEAVSCYLEFFSGRMPYLGFMSEQETHWAIGLGYSM